MLIFQRIEFGHRCFFEKMWQHGFALPLVLLKSPVAVSSRSPVSPLDLFRQF